MRPVLQGKSYTGGSIQKVNLETGEFIKVGSGFDEQTIYVRIEYLESNCYETQSFKRRVFLKQCR